MEDLSETHCGFERERLELPSSCTISLPQLMSFSTGFNVVSMENPRITREQLLHWGDIFEAPTVEEAALSDNAFTLEL
ncbi:MAG: hypothetical protein DMG70_28570 [Acidobacteria bacterium]|nr:MAG: hypothetical protein DMG70_28570 [Acidobacteriota bacterium]